MDDVLKHVDPVDAHPADLETAERRFIHAQAGGGSTLTQPRSRSIGSAALGSRMRTTLLALLVVLVGVSIVKPSSSGGTEDFAAVAATVNAALTRQTGVTGSSGGYLPGTGIVLATSVTGVPTTQLNAMLEAALQPSADRLSLLPGTEAISWQTAVTDGTSGNSSWLVRIGRDGVLDPTTWVTVPIMPTMPPMPTMPTTGNQARSAAGTTASAAAAGTTPTTPTTTTTVGAATVAAAVSGAAPTTTTTAAAGGPVSDNFAKDTGTWTPLTGTWAVTGGTYHETDDSGYDFITELTSAVPASYTVSVKMRGVSTAMLCGLMIGQPTPGSRQGATIVDLAAKDYLRWGRYDATSGTYNFVGGANLGAAQDPKRWHTMTLVVGRAGTKVSWDGKVISTFAAVSGGHVGLVTSKSAVEFDDFTVTPG